MPQQKYKPPVRRGLKTRSELANNKADYLNIYFYIGCSSFFWKRLGIGREWDDNRVFRVVEEKVY